MFVYNLVCVYGLFLVSVFDVEIICDMVYVKIFVIVLMFECLVEVMKGLKELVWELCMDLVKVMKLCYVFELYFYYDDLVDCGECIDNILCDLFDMLVVEKSCDVQGDDVDDVDDVVLVDKV